MAIIIEFKIRNPPNYKNCTSSSSSPSSSTIPAVVSPRPLHSNSQHYATATNPNIRSALFGMTLNAIEPRWCTSAADQIHGARSDCTFRATCAHVAVSISVNEVACEICRWSNFTWYCGKDFWKFYWFMFEIIGYRYIILRNNRGERLNVWEFCIQTLFDIQNEKYI